MKYDVLALIINEDSAVVKDVTVFRNFLQSHAQSETSVLVIAASNSINLVIAGAQASTLSSIPPFTNHMTRHGFAEVMNWITEAECTREADGKAANSTAVFADFDLKKFPTLYRGLKTSKRLTVLDAVPSMPAQISNITAAPLKLPETQRPHAANSGGLRRQKKAKSIGAVFSFLLKFILIPFAVGGAIGSGLVVLPQPDINKRIFLLLVDAVFAIYMLYKTIALWADSKLGSKMRRMLFTLFWVACFLQLSYMPNVFAAPINAIAGEVFISEVYYHDRGFLGMYKVTGACTRVFSDWYYVGGIVDNKFSGLGKAVYANGSIFEGFYYNEQRNGHGMWTYADGSTFECFFVNGVGNGPGRIITESGQIQEGNFENGNKNGVFLITNPDGQAFYIEYEDGAKVS